MTHLSRDAIDEGFSRRFQARMLERDRRPVRNCEPLATIAALPAAGVGIAEATAESWRPAACPADAPLVTRLLHAAPQAWAALAERIEHARRDGASVVAVAGARRGEGRTTVVQCLARTLRDRGLPVECHDLTPASGATGAGIVLVDAGVWFSGGPLRLSWLEHVSRGCHAALLVRRAGQPAVAARGKAIEAIGVKVLGEILTRVPECASQATG